MSGVVELIKARQETERAKVAEEKLNKEMETAARDAAFKPIMEIWDEAKGLPIKNPNHNQQSYREMCSRTTQPTGTLEDALADGSSQHLRFWDGHGDYGFNIRLENAPVMGYPTRLSVRLYTHDKTACVDMAEAKHAFIGYLATITDLGGEA